MAHQHVVAHALAAHLERRAPPHAQHGAHGEAPSVMPNYGARHDAPIFEERRFHLHIPLPPRRYALHHAPLPSPSCRSALFARRFVGGRPDWAQIESPDNLTTGKPSHGLPAARETPDGRKRVVRSMSTSP